VTERYVRIGGWGKYLPERIMPNAELAELVDTTDEWIRSRTGIRERRIAAPDETTCTLAVHAARAALDRAQVRPEDLDLIIVATCTPDYANMPATASLVQHALGASHAGAFDLNAVCSGFVYGLATGSQFILSGAHKSVLVIGADVFTRILDWQDRSTCVLFGDGAGAVVLEPSEAPGVIDSSLHLDGNEYELLTIPAGGVEEPASAGSIVTKIPTNKIATSWRG